MQELIGIQFLSRLQVESLHEEMLTSFGGGLPGIRDENMLESAIGAPKATMFGGFLHETIHEMAAAYLFSLVNNHPFLDGNKRTAAHAVNTFYLMNGYVLTVRTDELVEYTVSVATAQKPTKAAIASFLQARTTKIQVAEG